MYEQDGEADQLGRFRELGSGPVVYDAITEIEVEVPKNDDPESLFVSFADFKAQTSSVDRPAPVAGRKYDPAPFRLPLPVKRGVCQGARPRASRGRSVKRRGSRRTPTQSRAGPSDESGDPEPVGPRSRTCWRTAGAS